MADDKSLEVIQKIAADAVGRLGIGGEVSVKPPAGGGDPVVVEIAAADPGMLIGRHGETLNSLQLVLGLIFYRQTGQWQRLLVDVGGYRGEQQGRLEDMARRTADRVRFFARPVSLPPMSPYERRLIHLFLSEDETVETESIGEGRERRVVVKPRQGC